jgi:primosomal protein dnaI
MEEKINREKYVKQIQEDPNIKKIITQYHLNQEDMDKGLHILLAYTIYNEKCDGCKGLDDCKQVKHGYMPHLGYNGVSFDIDYLPCEYKERLIHQKNLENNLVCYSCNLNSFDFNHLYINKNRKDVLEKIKTCLKNYKNNLPTKGIYIHGMYGCGKSYLLAYLAKDLANSNHKVIFAYYPDLVRMIKGSIAGGNLEEIVERLKEIEVLVLDDFGGEMLTGFIRDEVLGVILQDRMSNGRLTFMSSNLDDKLLQEHLRESTKDTDALRASRIYERIRTLMDFVELKDQNYRK